MPELLTKHPEIVKRVMESGGARCGTEPQILTECPSSQMCRFPNGEVCVYDVASAGDMTQLSRADFLQAAGKAPLLNIETIGLAVITFILGVVAAIIYCRRKDQS